MLLTDSLDHLFHKLQEEADQPAPDGAGTTDDGAQQPAAGGADDAAMQ